MKSEDPGSRVLDLDGVLTLRAEAVSQGRSVVLTNGCFDLLHRGHISYLQESAHVGDLLIVAINSDESVRELKGPSRPVNSEQDRAFAIASLRCVDAAFICRGPRLYAEIAAIRPDHYTKAGDYTFDTLDAGERDALLAVGTKIHLLSFVDGHSTTSLLQRSASPTSQILKHADQ
jgi:rfaE bifunctional protein nucleotidyltransferase chain/domain